MIDVIGIAAAAFAALAFALLDERMLNTQLFFGTVAFLVVIQLVTNYQFGLYGRAWRFASVGDLARIVGSVLTGAAIATAIVALGVVAGILQAPGQNSAPVPPIEFLPLEVVFTLFVVGGARFAIRAASDFVWWTGREGDVEGRPTLLYGAGRIGVMMARSAQRKPAAGVIPVGFLDDDPVLKGTKVAGLPVFGGLANLEHAVQVTGARELLITMATSPGMVIRRILEVARELKLEVRTVPSIDDLLDGTVDAYRVRDVKVEDLLRRPTASDHAPAVQGTFRGRVILITGAAGSIGSELARQVFALRPRRLILVDRAESPLYLLQRQLEEAASHDNGAGELRVHLANVASRPMMARLVAAEKPDVILHAAAYKHVPMMEEHPSDAVHVNVGGTMALLDAAAAVGVQRFVLVSTDKAVRPSSVMGASKRVAEMLVADTALRVNRPYVSVRFGNVLGSNGSVIPIFQDQLQNGRPLTITDPEMTRYFMTIPEATWLILEAAALGQTGDLFVLDMGEPIKIMDIARDLTRLAGRDPETQPIEIVGLRPGEKLHEELFYDAEEVEPTSTQKLLRTVTTPPPPTIRTDVHAMLELASGEHDGELRDTLHDMVHPENPRRVVAMPVEAEPDLPPPVEIREVRAAQLRKRSSIPAILIEEDAEVDGVAASQA
jgi:FlaA1/EpsC-like NDP-sugar epimerase